MVKRIVRLFGLWRSGTSCGIFIGWRRMAGRLDTCAVCSLQSSLWISKWAVCPEGEGYFALWRANDQPILLPVGYNSIFLWVTATALLKVKVRVHDCDEMPLTFEQPIKLHPFLSYSWSTCWLAGSIDGSVWALMFVSHLQSQVFWQYAQKGQLADHEEQLAKFDKTCIGLESQTTPLKCSKTHCSVIVGKVWYTVIAKVTMPTIFNIPTWV